MPIELSDDLKEYAREKVASGAYKDTDALFRAALREKMQAERTNLEEIEALREEIEIGWQQAERGEFADFDPERVNRKLDREFGV